VTETPYLIAHKVRGQPAFDVAIQMEMEDEVWWIIPTSGHRAYPYWHQWLGIEPNCLYINEGHTVGVRFDIPDCPDPWPDHYWQPGQTNDLEIPDNAGAGLLASLGITRPQSQPLVRRKL
jgi:hypothetical protein